MNPRVKWGGQENGRKFHENGHTNSYTSGIIQCTSTVESFSLMPISLLSTFEGAMDCMGCLVVTVFWRAKAKYIDVDWLRMMFLAMQ